MSNDKPLKSAYELAMERLLEQDREKGLEQPAPLSDAQKKQIKQLRQDAKAKRAELEILREKRMASTAGDPEKLAEEEEHYRIDRRRIDEGLESAVAAVKRGGE